jgi:hypothetical protein
MARRPERIGAPAARQANPGLCIESRPTKEKPMSRSWIRLSTALVLSVLAAAAPAAAVEKTVPFALDQWIELKTTEGPVTLHRIRLASQSGVTKSKIFRPGGSSYTADVQIQLEFSNDATADYEARIRFEWLDASGAVIDGFEGGEGLDSEARFEQQTVTLSTLRYGLDRAKSLRFSISVSPE